MSEKLSPLIPAVRTTRIIGSSEASTAGEVIASRRSRRGRTDWRQGGRAVGKWDRHLLVVVFMCAGAGVIGASAVRLISAPWSELASTIALWGGLAGAVVYALLRARPAGLLHFTATDVLWGIGFGSILRLLQGWLSGADTSAFPSALVLDAEPTAGWWVSYAIPASVIAPIVEELFFRAVVLVAVYQVFRRSAGTVAAAVAALLLSAGSFVILHAAFQALTLQDGVQLFIVGATCAQLVLLTGRIWGAVLCHVVYNATYLALMFIGTYLA